MKVLLDESVPVDLRYEFTGHDVYTARYMGWTSIVNSELLALARKDGFEVLVTCDQNMRYEQNIMAQDVSIVVLKAVSNRIRHLLPLMPHVHVILPTLKHGQVVEIDG